MADPVRDGPAPPPVLPTHDDPFVRATSGALGGPVGRHARLGERRYWLPIRLLVLFAVVGGTLSWVTKSSCATHGYEHEYQYTRLCYTDVLALWYDEHLNEGRVPILDNETPQPDAQGVVSHKYVEYPVIIGALMDAAMFPVRAWVPSGPSPAQQAALDRFAQDQAQGLSASNPGPNDRYAIDQLRANQASADYQSRQARYFFDLTAAYLVIFAVVAVVLTGLTAGRRIWDAAMIGLSPVLVLNGVVNWDLAAVALTAAAIFAWSRRRPALAGVLLGLGTATKLYPVLLLVPLLALCVRAGAVRSWLRALAGAAVAWLVVDVPFMVASPAGFWRFYTFNRERGTEYNSLFYAWQYFVNGQRSLSTGVLNGVSGFLLLVALAAIFVLILLVRRRPRLGQVAFLTVFAFVITNKVYSPQYALWLLPLVVLARPRWRYFLVWQMSELILFVTLYQHLVFVDKGGAKGIGYAWFFGMGLLPRDLVLLGLVGLVVYEILHPDADVVRAAGDDDPAGGVLDGAPDALALAPGRSPGPEHGVPPRADVLGRVVAPPGGAVMPAARLVSGRTPPRAARWFTRAMSCSLRRATGRVLVGGAVLVLGGALAVTALPAAAAQAATPTYVVTYGPLPGQISAAPTGAQPGQTVAFKNSGVLDAITVSSTTSDWTFSVPLPAGATSAPQLIPAAGTYGYRVVESVAGLLPAPTASGSFTAQSSAGSAPPPASTAPSGGSVLPGLGGTSPPSSGGGAPAQGGAGTTGSGSSGAAGAGTAAGTADGGAGLPPQPSSFGTGSGDFPTLPGGVLAPVIPAAGGPDAVPPPDVAADGNGGPGSLPGSDATGTAVPALRQSAATSTGPDSVGSIEGPAAVAAALLALVGVAVARSWARRAARQH